MDNKIARENQAIDGDLHDEEGDENAKIFPQRLMEILTEPSNADSITWLPHGNAFIIINRQKFANNVLPKYFRKTKYTSFTRKLNRWNFTRVTRGPELGAYYHEFFQRGSESMCTQMYCKNERAKFAVSPKDAAAAGKESTTPNKPSESSVSKDTQKPIIKSGISSKNPMVVDADHLMKVSNLLGNKPALPTVDPTLQTRAMLLGQQNPFQQTDPVTQALIANALRMQAQQQQAAHLFQQNNPQGLLRMQQLAALQQHQQQQQQQRMGQTKKTITNYRASAA